MEDELTKTAFLIGEYHGVKALATKLGDKFYFDWFIKLSIEDKAAIRQHVKFEGGKWSELSYCTLIYRLQYLTSLLQNADPARSKMIAGWAEAVMEGFSIGIGSYYRDLP